MAILDEVLNEEFDRLQRIRAAMLKELELLPKGYISMKNIHGKQYPYLQKREGSKVVSQSVASHELEDLEQKIARRKQLQASLREVEGNIKKLERVIQ